MNGRGRRGQDGLDVDGRLPVYVNEWWYLNKALRRLVQTLLGVVEVLVGVAAAAARVAVLGRHIKTYRGTQYAKDEMSDKVDEDFGMARPVDTSGGSFNQAGEGASYWSWGGPAERQLVPILQRFEIQSRNFGSNDPNGGGG